MDKLKKYCSCGFPQSHPIPHEHDRTEREKVIIKYYEARQLEELDEKEVAEVILAHFNPLYLSNKNQAKAICQRFGRVL